MPDRQYVKVKLVCERCRSALALCMAVARNVPEPIGCSPGAPVGGSGQGWPFLLSCPSCAASWHMTVSEMQERVNDATRHGWGQHIREGAVVLRCSAA